jgi:nitric oxide reductase NorQ protein
MPSFNDFQSTLIKPRPMPGFIRTPMVDEITARARNYLQAGFPLHFRGPTGAGKTTLALHIASKLKQPVVLIHGDDQFTTTDLTGRYQGYKRSKMVDEFVRGVSKTEERETKAWVEHRLTIAVKYGYTLLYDEFTRSRPEANNILLSVLQEGILDFPVEGSDGESFMKVHPNFKAIFTSNPEEYAGVHKTQDALLDRMATIDLEPYDEATEIEITATKSGLHPGDAGKVVAIARALRDAGISDYLPSIRGCIMVAKSVQGNAEANVAAGSKAFHQICRDIFLSEVGRNADKKKREELTLLLDALINQHCNFNAQPFMGSATEKIAIKTPKPIRKRKTAQVKKPVVKVKAIRKKPVRRKQTVKVKIAKGAIKISNKKQETPVSRSWLFWRKKAPTS